MTTIINLFSTATAFFKSLLGIPGNLIPATVDMKQQDYRVMTGERASPRPDTMEASSDASEGQAKAAPCASDAVDKEQDPLVDVAPAPSKSTLVKAKNQAAAAREFVSRALCDGPVAAATIKQMAEEAGFTHRQLRHAAEAMAVVHTKLPGMRTGWLWALPSASVPATSDSHISSGICLEVGVA